MKTLKEAKEHLVAQTIIVGYKLDNSAYKDLICNACCDSLAIETHFWAPFSNHL